jgi:hypothetical protein
MHVLPYAVFKDHGRIPRSTDIEEGIVLFKDGMQVVFVSHQWWKPSTDASISHPDNAENEKFGLICEAIENQRLEMGLPEDLASIYLWIDYACIPQGAEYCCAWLLPL